jgi:TolB protein
VKSGVAWTPDGEIIYAHRAGSNYDLWITPVDGREPKQLTANAGNNLLPRVSPDGRQIVFSSDRTGTSHVWKMGIDGSDATQLTNGDGEGFRIGHGMGDGACTGARE